MAVATWRSNSHCPEDGGNVERSCDLIERKCLVSSDKSIVTTVAYSGHCDGREVVSRNEENGNEDRGKEKMQEEE